MAVPRCTLSLLRGRLIGLHNAAAPGTWSTSVPSGATGDKRRNDTELDNSILSSDNKVCYRIASLEGHGYRSLFMLDSADLTNGQVLPDHIGPVGQVRIKYATADSDYKPGKHDEQLTVGDIIRWRANLESLYGTSAHSVADSPLAGFYIILGSEIYFTGHVARAQLANVIRTSSCQAPEAFEDLVLADAYLMSKKEGDSTDFVGLVQGYKRECLEMLDSGAMTLPRLQTAQEAAA
jgi:hypothetical protein